MIYCLRLSTLACCLTEYKLSDCINQGLELQPFDLLKILKARRCSTQTLVLEILKNKSCLASGNLTYEQIIHLNGFFECIC